MGHAAANKTEHDAEQLKGSMDGEAIAGNSATVVTEGNAIA